MGDDLARELDNLEQMLDGSKIPGNLKLSVLCHITENFSEDRKIGEGGCGHVYKGILPRRGKMVAVKKLLNRKTTHEMFRRELTIMLSVEHKNIVRLIGFCSHTEQTIPIATILADEQERLLCFEYISNGTLANKITDELRGLEWGTRFEIIKGLCEGLRYLHYKGKGIIHMDLKPANILLDHDMVPKITDFGISRLEGETTSQECLCSIPYCAPEYRLHEEMSVKSDIYSLGVIIMEIVTGTRDFETTVIRKAHRRWMQRWKNAKQASLRYQQQLTKCLELAQRCTDFEPTERPDILVIIHELEMDSTLDMLGIEPLDLHFTAEHKKQTSGSVKLTNDTDGYIAFQISHVGKNAFGVSKMLCVRPNKEVVPPQSSCRVIVTLEAAKNPLQQKHYIEEFCVKSTRVDKGVTSEHITGDTFKEEACKDVDMVKLMVSVRAPKLLVVDPLELRYGPLEPNKPSSCVVQLTNVTDDYVAFAFELPQQGEVLYYYEAMGTGIMPPRSTRGVVVDLQWGMRPTAVSSTSSGASSSSSSSSPPSDFLSLCQEIMLEAMIEWRRTTTESTRLDIQVKEKAIREMMQSKGTCIVRSIIVRKGLRDNDVSVEFFNDKTGVHQMKLDIVFADRAQLPPSSLRRHCPMFGDKLAELLGDRASMQTSPFLIETELLHIYPAEVRLASEGGADQYISLANKTDDDVMYAINYYDQRREDEDEDEGDRGFISTFFSFFEGDSSIPDDRGLMLPKSTRAVRVPYNYRDHYGHIRVMMISGSRSYRTPDGFYDNCTYDKREDLMRQVRAEGGKAHEALLACVVNESSNSKRKHKKVGLKPDSDSRYPECMDVHPTKPWIVTGHKKTLCIWNINRETGACEERMKSKINKPHTMFMKQAVKFIARMQWVAYADCYTACIAVFTYADNRLAEIKRFQADHELDPLICLAVHPTLPYLLSSSYAGNLIQLWNWEKGWICIRKFKYSGTPGRIRQMIFDPAKDANSFVSLHKYGEINIWSIDNEKRTNSFRGDIVGIAYCNVGTNMLATVSSTGKTEILDLHSNTAHIQTIEDNMGGISSWAPSPIASHPTLPLLATAEADVVHLWNYTSYGLKRVNTFHDPGKHSNTLGFIDMKGFQRLVIANYLNDTTQIVDFLDGAMLTGRPWG